MDKDKGHILWFIQTVNNSGTKTSIIGKPFRSVEKLQQTLKLDEEQQAAPRVWDDSEARRVTCQTHRVIHIGLRKVQVMQVTMTVLIRN